MIEVKGLKHTYATKSRDNVLALKGVNFSLGDSGMYFIGGKSGCGKSTLLNLLGGLAKIQEGDILFNGVSLKEFSAVEYDAYRASEVGIIFQEFNLIDNLTVGENIELQLNIARANADKEVIAQSLKRVDLEGYERRMPYELSGGQKQRVAIARQLAKGAKVILADEPTGNLDSENATNVFETLKNLSEEIAVVVVSHDMESAYKYGDQIITLKDGLVEKIEVQNDYTQTNEEQKKSAYKAVKPHFPFKYVAKLASKNIFKRKIRFTISLVLSLLSCVMFCVLGSLLSIDANRSLADKMYNDNMPFYQYIQGLDFGGGTINVEAGRANVSYIAKHNIENKYTIGDEILFQYDIKFGTDYYTLTPDRYTPKGVYWHGDSYIQIASAEDIKNILGYEMLGEVLPLDMDSAYITDYYALGIIKTKQKYLDGDVAVEIEKDAKIEDLVGKTFVMENREDCTLKVAGIIKTDYEKYGLIEKYEKLQAIEDKTPNGAISFSPESELTVSELAIKKLYCSLFVNEEAANKIASGKGVLNFLEIGVSSSEFIDLLENDGFYINGENYSVDIRPSKGCTSFFELLYTADGLQKLDRTQPVSVEEDEVILSKGVYESIFGEQLKTEDYYTAEWVDMGLDMYMNPMGYYKYTPKNAIPPRVGETITLCLNYESIGKKVERQVKVKGVLFRENPEMMGMGITYVSDGLFTEFAVLSNKNVSQVLVKKTETPEKLLEYTNFFSKYVIYPDTNYTQEIIFTEGTLVQLRTFFLVFGSAFLIISLLMFINYISSVIADGKKTIGIIRAIGGTGGSIFKIYYVLGVLFWLVTTIVSSIAYMIVLPLLNSVFTQGVLVGVQFLYYSFAAIGLVALLLFAVMTLASFLPIIKVSRKSPIEVIADK